MQDEEIQKATASEPLTLPEEHSMQQSWRLDHDKLTFILCHSPSSSTARSITPEVDDSPEKMIGDVNLFLYEDEDDEKDSDEGAKGSRAVIGEIEIMIAAISTRRKGLAQEALAAFLGYITLRLDVVLEEYRAGSDERSERCLKYLRVKIDQHNVASTGLFSKIGFKRVGEVNYFGEVEMRLGCEGLEGLEKKGEIVKYGA